MIFITPIKKISYDLLNLGCIFDLNIFIKFGITFENKIIIKGIFIR
jgi:hypothetical protein